jgi:hypothetical protein
MPNTAASPPGRATLMSLARLGGRSGWLMIALQTHPIVLASRKGYARGFAALAHRLRTMGR